MPSRPATSGAGPGLGAALLASRQSWAHKLLRLAAQPPSHLQQHRKQAALSHWCQLTWARQPARARPASRHAWPRTEPLPPPPGETWHNIGHLVQLPAAAVIELSLPSGAARPASAGRLHRVSSIAAVHNHAAFADCRQRRLDRTAALEARVAELELENASLRRQLRLQPGAAPTASGAAAPVVPSPTAAAQAAQLAPAPLPPAAAAPGPLLPGVPPPAVQPAIVGAAHGAAAQVRGLSMQCAR